MTDVTGSERVGETSYRDKTGSKMTGGEKAYAIILNVPFPLITTVTMWFCWHVYEPAKARQALLYGLVVSCVVLAIDLFFLMAFLSILIPDLQGSALRS